MTDTSPAKLCPICRKRTATSEYKPFCTKRCADVDLGRWLNGSYVITGSAETDEDGEDATADQNNPDNH